MEINFTPDQEAQLVRFATGQGTDMESLVKSAALDLVEEDREFRATVRAGIAQANRGELLEHEDVKSRILGRFRR
jgi:predicted transcriptional regulator